MTATTIKDQLRVSFRAEGKDHVNLSHHSETQLGVVCSPEWRRRFFVPHLGDFGSPRCFANWMISRGDEQARHSHRFQPQYNVPMEQFRDLMLYGKFFQLLQASKVLRDEKELMSLPWLVYKRHLSGIKEFDRWEDYPNHVKSMARLVSKHGTATRFSWDHHLPNVLPLVNKLMIEIAVANGVPPDQAKTIQELDAIEEANAKRHTEKEGSRNRSSDSDSSEEQPLSSDAGDNQTSNDKESTEASDETTLTGSDVHNAASV